MAHRPRVRLAHRGLILLLLAAACAPKAVPRPEKVEKPAEAWSGLASFYGEGFDGKLTANGERFDRTKLTAAHKTLPFGTCLKVTAVESGRSVKVRVNDRGPYVAGRIIDLSEGAAKVIGITDQGVAQVRLQRCSD